MANEWGTYGIDFGQKKIANPLTMGSNLKSIIGYDPGGYGGSHIEDISEDYTRGEWGNYKYDPSEELSKDRDWRTRWISKHSYGWGERVGGIGPKYWDTTGRWGTGTGGKSVVEVLDTGAYAKDPLYKKAAKEMLAAVDKNDPNVPAALKFRKWQDVVDVEDYMQGKQGWWTPKDELIGDDDPIKEKDPFQFDPTEFTSEWQSQIDKITDQLGDFDPGEVPKLEDQIKQMRTDILSQLGPEFQGALEEFKASDWLDSHLSEKIGEGTEGFAKLSDVDKQIATLQETLQGDLSAGIGERTNDIWKAINDAAVREGGLSQNLAGLTKDFAGLQNVFTDHKGTLEGLFEEGGKGHQELTDLSSRLGTSVSDLQAELSGIFEQGGAGAAELALLKKNLEADYGSKLTNLDQTWSDKLTNLESTTTQQLGDYRKSLEGLSGTVDDWASDTETWRSNLDDRLANMNTTTSQAIDSVRGDLGQDLAQATTNVRNELGLDLSNLGTKFTSDLATNRQALEGLISDNKLDFQSNLAEAQQAAQTGIAGAKQEAQTGISELRSELGDRLATQKGEISGLSALQARQGQDISQLGADLLTTAGSLQSNIDEKSKAFNERLTKLSSSMNYRMLGDSAAGVRMRQSRARERGDARFGTGRFNRSMQISALNL